MWVDSKQKRRNRINSQGLYRPLQLRIYRSAPERVAKRLYAAMARVACQLDGRLLGHRVWTVADRIARRPRYERRGRISKVLGLSYLAGAMV